MVFDSNTPERVAENLQKLQDELNAGKTAKEELRALTSQLHSGQRHPDYEYTTVKRGRKQGDDTPPEGHGWEINVDINGDGFDRDDWNDIYFWRRLKTDAIKDGVSPYDLKPVTLPPVEHSVYLDLLRGHIGKGYMPSATADRYHSKPEYIPGFTKDLETGEIATFGFTGFFCDEALSGADRPIWAYVELPTVELITNLTTEQTYVRVKQPYSKWREWYSTIPLNINLYDAAKVIHEYL